MFNSHLHTYTLTHLHTWHFRNVQLCKCVNEDWTPRTHLSISGMFNPHLHTYTLHLPVHTWVFQECSILIYTLTLSMFGCTLTHWASHGCSTLIYTLTHLAFHASISGMSNPHLHTYTYTLSISCVDGDWTSMGYPGVYRWALTHLHTYTLSISGMSNPHLHTYTLTHLASFMKCSGVYRYVCKCVSGVRMRIEHSWNAKCVSV